MILSRFWYLALALVAGLLAYVLLLATSIHNRDLVRATGQSLASDTQVVASWLRDDARKRSSALLPTALDEEIRAQLARSSAADKVPPDARDKARAALRKQAAAVAPELAFDAIFAIDQQGRVVAQTGFDQASGIDGFELGGYPLVADALHGWLRDDAWVFGNTIWRVVARPVEVDATSPPAGAIVGARAVNDSFARELSRRTGAAVAFFVGGQRVASGAPEGFDVSQLDTIGADLSAVQADPAYQDKGTSDVRMVTPSLGVVYAKLPGEAWDLGAGYVVGRLARLVASPKAFLDAADDRDKQSVPVGLLAGLALAAGLVGIVLTFVEHSRPLSIFAGEAARLASGQSDQLVASRLTGVYRRIASSLNDGVDRIVAKGGGGRRADLAQVLGPLPAQPAMSAFSLPDGNATTVPDPLAAARRPEPSVGARRPEPPVGARRPEPPTPTTAPEPITPPAPRAPAPAPIAPPPDSNDVPAVLTVPPPAPVATPAPKPPPPKPPPPRTARPVPSDGAVKRAAPFAGDTDGAGLPPVADADATVTSAPALADAVASVRTPPTVEMPPAKAAALRDFSEDADESTVVSRAPIELLQQAGLVGEDSLEWRAVYEDFLRVKRECGESVDGLTFERFAQTLTKNRDALVQRHPGTTRVKFSVYVKEGRAALKASPTKD